MTPGDLRIDPRRDFACPIGVKDHLPRCGHDARILATFHLQGFYARRIELVFFQYDEGTLMILSIAVLFMLLLVTLLFGENVATGAQRQQ